MFVGWLALIDFFWLLTQTKSFSLLNKTGVILVLNATNFC